MKVSPSKVSIHVLTSLVSSFSTSLMHKVSAAGWAALGDFVSERASSVDPNDSAGVARAAQQLKRLPRQAIEGLVESHYVDLSLRAGHTR